MFSSWNRSRAFESFVAALVVAGALSLVPRQQVHPDTSRDLLIARDCREGGHCASVGATTSASRSLPQSGLLPAWAAWAGAGPAGLARVRARSIAELALCALLLARLRGVFVGVSGALALALCVGTPVLWNPTLLPLPCVLSVLCTLESVRRDAPSLAVCGALALGFAAHGHPIVAVLGPWWLMVVTAALRLPFVTVLAGTVLALVALALPMPGWPPRVLLDHRMALALLAMIPVFFWAFRKRAGMRALSPEERERAAIHWCLAWGAIALAMIALSFRWPALRYIAPWIAPALLLASSRTRQWRWVVCAGALLMLLFVGEIVASRSGLWRYDEAQQVALRLASAGLRADTAPSVLRGQNLGPLVAATLTEIPAPRGFSATTQTFTVTRDASGVRISSMPSVLDEQSLVVCAGTEPGQVRCRASALRPMMSEGELFRWASLAYPTLPALLFEGEQDLWMEFHLSLRAGAPPRRFDVPPNSPFALAVRGAVHCAQMGTSSVVLRDAGHGAALVLRGRVSMERFHGWLPDLIESDVGGVRFSNACAIAPERSGAPGELPPRCRAQVRPELTRRVFDAVRDASRGAVRCTLEGVSATRTAVVVTVSSEGERFTAVLSATECAEVFQRELVLTEAPALRARCPAISTALHRIVDAKQEPRSLPAEISRTRAYAGVAGVWACLWGLVLLLVLLAHKHPDER